MTDPLQSNKSERFKALLVLIATAFLWSLGGILIKIVDWHPLALAGTRSFFASLVFLVYLGKPKFAWSLPQIGGAITYVGVVVLIVLGTKLTTAANAILLHYTAPIYVALLAPWFLKERAKLMDWLFIGVVFLGMVLFFFDNFELASLWGNILAAISGLCYGIMILCLRMQKDGSPFESVLLGNLLTALIGLPFIFLGGPLPGFSGWLAMLVLGIFQLGIPYILYVYALKRVTALDAILIPIIEPILNPLWVFLFIGERPGRFALLGGIIVLGMVVFRSIYCNESLKKKSKLILEKD